MPHLLGAVPRPDVRGTNSEGLDARGGQRMDDHSTGLRARLDHHADARVTLSRRVHDEGPLL